MSSASNVIAKLNECDLVVSMGSDTEISVINAKNTARRYICNYNDCLASFNRPSKLVRHICSHTKERPFKCDYPDCKKDYTNNSHLRRHVLTSHKKPNTPIILLSCPYDGCMTQCQNKYSLKKHCKSHTIYSYNCPDCGEKFKKKRQLIAHSYQHKGPLSFICIHCNQNFATERELKNHGEKHRIYVCEYPECREEFLRWSLLRKHFKIKHKRIYECDFCKKTFMNKNTMMKHIMTHLDIPCPKVYLCQHKGCLRYYKYKKNLTHHIRVAHEGKTYECTETGCKQVFMSKRRLKDHLIRHKNGTLNTPRTYNREKPRKPRKDKGLSKSSKAAMLSGLVLSPEVNKCLAQNKITPEIEENIKGTIDLLREVEEDESHDEEYLATSEIQSKDASCSVMFIVNNQIT